MAKDRFNTPVAELFATLGLDASNLDSGLANSLVNIKDFQSQLNVTADQLRTSLHEVDPAINAVNAALKQASNDAKTFAVNTLGLADATDKLVANQERFEAQSIRMKEAYREAQAAMQIAEAERYERYVVEDEEMSKLDGERLARIEAINAAIISASIQETAAVQRHVAAIQESLPFLSAYGEAAGVGGGVGGGGRGGGNIGVRMGSGGINPYFRITESIAASLGPLMDLIFPIALITLGIDLWERFSTSMKSAVNSLTGAIDVFDQLDSATKTMLTAKEKELDQNERIRTQARRLGVSEQTLRAQIGSTITPETREIDTLLKPLITERGNLDSIVNTLKAVPPFARDTVIRAEGQKLGMTDAQDLDEKRLMQRQKDVIAEINKLTEQKVRLQTQEAESLDRGTKAHKKWHDEIHEYPNRLPWFLSSAPMAFPTYGAFGATDMGGGHTVSSSFSRQAPSPHAFGPTGTPGRTSTPTAPTSSRSGVSISIQNTFAPHFEGLPADIQAFVRDKMEPMFIQDMDHNSRAIASQLIEKLRKWGLN